LTASDPEDNPLYFIINWGDKTPSETIGPINVKEILTINHRWNAPGLYPITIYTQDILGQRGRIHTYCVIVLQSRTMEIIQSFSTTKILVKE
jgi:hypothetical protein